ncbi:MAG: efflux RND transporter periplasmic adaptor subunit [Janthinobacterium lividum]
MNQRRSHAARAFLAVVLAALNGCAAKKENKGPPPPPEAGYVVLRADTVPLFIELTGRTAAYESSDVRPQVAGLILARTFTEGSIVHKGQTLYKIDPSQYRATLAQAQATLSSAQANAASTRAKADRYKPLADMEAVAKQDYVDAKGTADQATASVAQNRAAVQTAKINLGFTDIPAPITGRIGRSQVTTGGLVTVGQTMPLTTIQRLDPMFVDIQQSSADLLSLRAALASGGRAASSAAVTLILADGSTYGATGRVEFAEAMVDASTGTVTLRARFPNPHGILLPGMFVRARLSQQTVRDAILAPQAGISRDPKGNATAMVVARDDPAKDDKSDTPKSGGAKSGDSGGTPASGGKPARTGFTAVSRDVTLGRTVGDKWLVTKGLAAGDKLIVEGLNRIKPGQAIKPVPAGSKPAPRPAASDDSAKS